MKFSESCIQRPVLSWVLTLVLIILGTVGGMKLGLQQFPRVESPFVTIETTLPGAAPEVVESQVTRIIEEAMAGLEGVAAITSTSGIEESKVTLEFITGYKKDPTVAIINRLNKCADRIPDEATDPTLTESKSEEKAILSLALTSDVLSSSELADYALNDLQKDLESLPGVARVDVVGGGHYIMHVYIDPIKIAAYHITIAEVKNAVRRQSIDKPAGKLITDDREYLVTTQASMSTPEEFNEMVVVAKNGHLIRVRDIGHAEISAEDHKTRSRLNGRTGITLGIIKQATANPIDVARQVKKMIPSLEERLPKGVNMYVASDRTLFIEQSLQEVYRTIFEAAILVVIVVILFLNSLKAASVPIVTIPVSLVGTLFFMYLFGFTINNFTLLAMVLAIGLVVDDAIIVLENIYRHIEEGVQAWAATVKGVREISFAVIATTLTLIAVYAPISLSAGLTGKLFTEFAITLACAVLISGFAALTLSPMMCARLLTTPHSQKRHNFVTELWEKIKNKLSIEEWLAKIEPQYAQLVSRTLERKWSTLTLGLSIALIGVIVYLFLPQELFPAEDQGQIIVEGQAPPSSTLEYTDRYVKQIDKVLANIPEIEKRTTQITNPTYEIYVQLKSQRERGRSTDEIVAELQKLLANVSGIEVRVNSSSTGVAERKGVSFVIMGNKTYRELKELSIQMNYELYESLAKTVRANVSVADSEDFIVTVNRNKISALGIEAATVAETVDTLIRGQKASTFKRENRLYDINVEAERWARRDPRDITNLFIQANDKDHTLVPLSELVTVEARAGPREIYHYNRVRAVNYDIELKPNYSTDAAISKIKSLASDILPRDVRIEFTGETKRFLEESSNVQTIFLLALVFIFLVMAAQFESWIDPLIIILTVPLSLTGAVVSLSLIENGSISLYSQIGFVTLIGLITKHGIMMVDFANRLRDEGKGIYEAIITASRLRLRPILMTTFAMVLGAIPLALSAGAGFESRRQIGWVIVGGMSIGTIFTLFILPSVYVVLTRRNRTVIRTLIETGVERL